MALWGDAVAKANISAVWDRATEFLGDNIGRLLPIAVPFIYLPQLVQLVLQPLAKSPNMAWIVQLIGFVMVLIALWGQLQVLALATDPARSVGDTRASATARIAVVVGLTLALFALFVILALPIPAALAFAGFDFAAAMQASATGTPVAPPPGMTPGIALFVVIYTVLLFAVAVWASARLLLINAIVLAERLSFRAIGRSVALTRGNTLALIGVLLLYLVVSTVATLAAQTVLGAVLGLLIGGTAPITLATVLTGVVVAGVATCFLLLFNAFTGKFYVAARAREAAGSA